MGNIQKDLSDKYRELAEDIQGLLDRIGPGEKLKDTRRGHQTVINQLESILRKLEKEYGDKCSQEPEPPSEAVPPLARPVPQKKGILEYFTPVIPHLIRPF